MHFNFMHFKPSAGLALALLTGAGLAAAPAQAQVTNPGFESGLTGWTHSGAVFAAPNMGDAHSGTGSAQFSNPTPNTTPNALGTLSQSIATTAGDSYTVSFYLLSNGVLPPSNEFKASFAGTQGLDLVNVAAFPYTLYSFTGVASSASSTLQFSAFNNPSSFNLDDVSVRDISSPVPEASSVVSLGLLLALGLGGLAISRRRKAGAAL